MRMNLDMDNVVCRHVPSGHFVLGRDVLCEFDYCLLAIGSKYASNKGMPAVSVKLLYL